MSEWLFTFVVAIFTPTGAVLIAGNAVILEAAESPCKEADAMIRKKYPESAVFTTCDRLDPKVKPTEYKRGNRS